MKRSCSLLSFAALFLVALGCASVEEPENLEHFMVHEDVTTGQMEFSLNWTVNGVRDDGMFADINLYLSPSIGIESSEKNDALSEARKSSLNIFGGAKMIPSRENLHDFYRHYIGVAFNGILAENVVYPINIAYTLTISQANVAVPIKVITGEFDIKSSNDLSKTFAQYQYRMDITESKYTDEYRHYAIRKLDKNIVESRLSDVVNTTTFTAEKLYVNFLWKGDGTTQGYQKADLDFYVHDITKDDIDSPGDLEESSSTNNGYEQIGVDSSKFNAGVPRKLGYSFLRNIAGSELQEVTYMYKVYSFSNNKIQRFVKFGSFDLEDIPEDDGTFYFFADVTWTKSTKAFKVTPLASTLVWKP